MAEFVDSLHRHSIEEIFANPRAREFFIKWLAEYGDDSIAQMGGIHLIFPSLSQIAIKHIEHQRIGIAPLEQSTRYVDFSSKINGKYRYYTDPTLESLGLKEDYETAMDNLFLTYTHLSEELFNYLRAKYPEENLRVITAKVFDTVRGLLPTCTLSQVGFFGNGQAFEYLIARSVDNHMGEIRWVGETAFAELSKPIPSFLRRLVSESSLDYRKYLSERRKRVLEFMKETDVQETIISPTNIGVELIDYDPAGESKIIAVLLWKEGHESFRDIFEKVDKFSPEQKEALLQKVLADRKAIWYKIPRAFEFADVMYEVVTNIGAWRDIQRHRLKTQERQLFIVAHGFDVPELLIEAGLDTEFSKAILAVENVYADIAAHDLELAQYCCTLAHRVRSLHKANLREIWWETELRTIAQGHPDYRSIEQQLAVLVSQVYPMLAKYLMVDMNSYEFARRGTPEKIAAKEARIRNQLSRKL